MIDALFGSKTRIKLLHLFMNNPGKSFYVREITRLIDEQINSVRRELANMLNVGVINSVSADNKLYYEVNQRYEFYVPLRAIFGDEKIEIAPPVGGDTRQSWRSELTSMLGVRVAVLAGVLVPGSTGAVDVLIAGTSSSAQVKKIIQRIEHEENREVNYVVMAFDELYYRLSVRDRFIIDIINNKHAVLVDTDSLLSRQNKE